MKWYKLLWALLLFSACSKEEFTSDMPCKYFSFVSTMVYYPADTMYLSPVFHSSDPNKIAYVEIRNSGIKSIVTYNMQTKEKEYIHPFTYYYSRLDWSKDGVFALLGRETELQSRFVDNEGSLIYQNIFSNCNDCFWSVKGDYFYWNHNGRRLFKTTPEGITTRVKNNLDDKSLKYFIISKSGQIAVIENENGSTVVKVAEENFDSLKFEYKLTIAIPTTGGADLSNDEKWDATWDAVGDNIYISQRRGLYKISLATNKVDLLKKYCIDRTDSYDHIDVSPDNRYLITRRFEVYQDDRLDGNKQKRLNTRSAIFLIDLHTLEEKQLKVD